MSKKKIGIIMGAGAACAGAVLFVIFGIHRHEWTAATCTEPETCLECGETRGEPLGHRWKEATCTVAATCSVCGETEGEALGHAWKEATCTTAATCSACGATEGEALGHSWAEANYQEASTCSVCGETEGEPLAGYFEEKQIICVSEENKSYDYVTSTVYNSEEKARGSVIMSGYRIFDSDETHPALENYEWVTAQFELAFGDKNAWRYSGTARWALSDYYTPKLCEESAESLEEAEDEDSGLAVQYTVNYRGTEYDQCIAYFTMYHQNDMKYAIYSMAFECYFRVPKGYDGMVVAFYDPALEAEENTEGELLTEDVDIIEQASVRIRLKKEDSDPGVPDMTVVSGILPVQPGAVIEASSVIRSDAQYKSGLYDLHKTAGFEDYDKNSVWDREPSYETATLTAETELFSQIEMPDEEGVYEVTAAVIDEDGHAVLSRMTVLVDGTAPEIHVPKEKITIRPGDAFAVMENVYGSDNACPDEDCQIGIDMDELQKLVDAMQAAKDGTYNLTYSAMDLVGNVGTKTIKLTISTGNGGQGASGGGQQGSGSGGNQQSGTQQESSSGGGNQQSSAPAQNQFMEDMARAAFDIVNQYRANASLEALTWNDSIYEGTKIRAQELVTLFDHTRPNGESCFTVLSGFMTYGENIAYGYRSASQVCEGWYNSEGHRNNMLNASFTQGAIACWYENGTYYWVNLFGG